MGLWNRSGWERTKRQGKQAGPKMAFSDTNCVVDFGGSVLCEIKKYVSRRK